MDYSFIHTFQVKRVFEWENIFKVYNNNEIIIKEIKKMERIFLIILRKKLLSYIFHNFIIQA